MAKTITPFFIRTFPSLCRLAEQDSWSAAPPDPPVSAESWARSRPTGKQLTRRRRAQVTAFTSRTCSLAGVVIAEGPLACPIVPSIGRGGPSILWRSSCRSP